ncbi:hypothetical protein T492DRAFT_837824 [Pavlovales sp. CCMP2436]|nr:hypothetical protein T492DRAFT_837824 [Pavlovales sp. CCMP2436]
MIGKLAGRGATTRRYEGSTRLQALGRHHACASLLLVLCLLVLGAQLTLRSAQSVASLDAEGVLRGSARAGTVVEIVVTQGEEQRGSAGAGAAAPLPAAARPAAHRYTRLAPTLADRKDLSVLVQYYNAPGRYHHLAIGPLLRGYRRCAAAANLTLEILVNAWLAELGPDDFLLLSPDIHELRAYNRLAAMSRGEQLLIVQDDESPNPFAPLFPGMDTWLRNASALLRTHEDVGVVGLEESAILHVAPAPPRAQGKQSCPGYSETERPRCVDPTTGTRTEAVLCAPAGPLLVRRSAFIAVRGYNESAVGRGTLGAIWVDCELQVFFLF